jgi:hypothetical protein
MSEVIIAVGVDVHIIASSRKRVSMVELDIV